MSENRKRKRRVSSETQITGRWSRAEDDILLKAAYERTQASPRRWTPRLGVYHQRTSRYISDTMLPTLPLPAGVCTKHQTWSLDSRWRRPPETNCRDDREACGWTRELAGWPSPRNCPAETERNAVVVSNISRRTRQPLSLVRGLPKKTQLSERLSQVLLKETMAVWTGWWFPRKCREETEYNVAIVSIVSRTQIQLKNPAGLCHTKWMHHTKWSRLIKWPQHIQWRHHMQCRHSAKWSHLPTRLVRKKLHHRIKCRQ